LQHDQGRTAEARSLLQSVYDRFSDGFETADLMTAKAYLDSWQNDLCAAQLTSLQAASEPAFG
jgi:hypothetical protein